MRLSDLLGSTVALPGGGGRETVGVVTDVRLAQVGPLRGVHASLVVESLLVSPRHTGSLFGYERDATGGPWPVRTVVRWLHRRAFLVDWSQVATWDPAARRVELHAETRRGRPEMPPGQLGTG